MMPLSDPEVQKPLAFILFAMIAGLLGHLKRSMDKPIKWKVALIESLSSGFVGCLAILMCRAFGLSFEWTGVIVGMFGWLGATASIIIVEKVVNRRLGIADENPFVKPYDGEERR